MTQRNRKTTPPPRGRAFDPREVADCIHDNGLTRDETEAYLRRYVADLMRANVETATRDPSLHYCCAPQCPGSTYPASEVPHGPPCSGPRVAKATRGEP